MCPLIVMIEDSFPSLQGRSVDLNTHTHTHTHTLSGQIGVWIGGWVIEMYPLDEDKTFSAECSSLGE